MKNTTEIILHFPLRKNSERRLELSDNPDYEQEKELNRFYNLTEKLQNNEWNQEYFLIYNSYSIDRY